MHKCIQSPRVAIWPYSENGFNGDKPGVSALMIIMKLRAQYFRPIFTLWDKIAAIPKLRRTFAWNYLMLNVWSADGNENYYYLPRSV